MDKILAILLFLMVITSIGNIALTGISIYYVDEENKLLRKQNDALKKYFNSKGK